MSETTTEAPRDNAPGDETLDGSGVAHGVAGYLLGFAFARAHWRILLLRPQRLPLGSGHTGRADRAGGGGGADGRAPRLLPPPHHGPESTNNVLALAFGVLIVLLLLAGSLFIMSNLDQNMPSMAKVMSMQR